VDSIIQLIFSISNYVLTSALDYYTDVDIDGSESAFTGWDKDASDDLELSTILAFNYYNSTDFSISDYLTKALWNTNYTANNDLWLADTNTQLSDGDISAFGYIKDYTETDPYWLANYSDFLTISAWNDTGLIKNWDPNNYIKDWNVDNYIKDWNSTGFIKDWSYIDTDTWDTSWLSNWTAYNSSWSSTYNATYDAKVSFLDLQIY